MRLEVHSEARQEFLEAVTFYDGHVPGLGLRFISEIDRCHTALLQSPLVGRSFGRRLRKWPISDKFPYMIIYAVLGEVLLIVAYAHGSRRPGYWRSRIVR